MGVDHLLGLKPHIHWDWHIEMLAAMDQNYQWTILGVRPGSGIFCQLLSATQRQKNTSYFSVSIQMWWLSPRFPKGFVSIQVTMVIHDHPWRLPGSTVENPRSTGTREPPCGDLRDAVHPRGVDITPSAKVQGVERTLWLCQNSYWKWWFIVDFPIENGDFP